MCAIRDRISASIIFSDLVGLFTRNRGGVIVDAGVASSATLCSYPMDGYTKAVTCFGRKGACVPGCYPDGQWCGQPGAGEHGSCSYPPEKLCESLAWQEHLPGLSATNNEIVLNALSTHFGGPPHGIRPPPAVAGFFMTGSDDEGVRRDRTKFLSLYPSANLPLVTLRLHADPPFELAVP